MLHDINQACRYADYLVALKAGHIYAQGKPEQVITETMMREVFGIECCILPDPVVGTPMCIPKSRHASVKASP